MGQAKVRREALRRKMLEDGKKWDFPASPWEAAVCAELNLKEDDVRVVRRAPAEQLDWMRMPANGCHANARWYAKNDPTGRTRAVVGWWVQWPDFVLHSVVEIDGQLICITPSAYNETEIPFMPDPKISWIEDGEVYSAIRDGQVVGAGVRTYPAFTVARNAILRERLLAGVDPFEATILSDELMERLKRQHVGAGD